jgi:hypothetical protein
LQASLKWLLALSIGEYFCRILGTLFGNAQMNYQERLSPIQHSKNWQEMNKGS